MAQTCILFYSFERWSIYLRLWTRWKIDRLVLQFYGCLPSKSSSRSREWKLWIVESVPTTPKQLFYQMEQKSVGKKTLGKRLCQTNWKQIRWKSDTCILKNHFSGFDFEPTEVSRKLLVNPVSHLSLFHHIIYCKCSKRPFMLSLKTLCNSITCCAHARAELTLFNKILSSLLIKYRNAKPLKRLLILNELKMTNE